MKQSLCTGVYFFFNIPNTTPLKHTSDQLPPTTYHRNTCTCICFFKKNIYTCIFFSKDMKTDSLMIVLIDMSQTTQK